MPRADKTTRTHGFTLIELLVVIGIIILLTAMVFPIVGSVLGRGRVESGVNTVAVAATVARAYAMRDKADLDQEITGASYSGTALLFAPDHQIRFLENLQTAKSQGGAYLESTDGRNGFLEIEAVSGAGPEPVKVPEGTGLMGVRRNGGYLELLVPPFAIRFDRDGQMLVADPGRPADDVFYDGNYDGEYDTTNSDRDNPSGDPVDWDPEAGAGTFDDAANQYELPFEQIECVIGVLVYDLNAFKLQFGYPAWKYQVADGSSPGAETAWLLDNGRMLLFNRYTGALLREVTP